MLKETIQSWYFALTVCGIYRIKYRANNEMIMIIFIFSIQIIITDEKIDVYL